VLQPRDLRPCGVSLKLVEDELQQVSMPRTQSPASTHLTTGLTCRDLSVPSQESTWWEPAATADGEGRRTRRRSAHRVDRYPRGCPQGVLAPPLRQLTAGARRLRDWYDRGYPTPEGGWARYDIHHIIPREYGGSNGWENLVPVLRETHQQEFNSWWLNYR
jgi:hypothetical protein